jgi:hypothetical protein
MLDRKLTTPAWTDFDSKAYLAWSHSLARMLSRLGLVDKSPSDAATDGDLTEHLAGLFDDEEAAA